MKLKTTLIIVAALVIAAIVQPSLLMKGIGTIEWKILNKQTAKLYHKKNYPKALLVAKHALKVAEEKIDPKHLKVATSLNYIGEIYLSQKKTAKAKEYLERALVIRKKKLGPNHFSVATSLNNLGALHYYEGNYSKAEKLHKRALIIRKKALGFYSSAVDTSLNNLAHAYMKLEKYNDALRVRMQSLKILEKLEKPENAYMASVLHDLGWLYYNQGNYIKDHRESDYKKSEAYYLRALAIRERIFKPNNEHVQSTLENLASLYRKTNNIAEAEKLENRIEKLDVEKKPIKTDPIKKMTNNTQKEDLVPYFIPSLSAILRAAEKQKGSPLTRQEVLDIRDNSQTIMTPKSMVEALAEKRGYKDIDPENCWNEWILQRHELGLEPIKQGGAMIIENPKGAPSMKKAEAKARETLGQFRDLLKQFSETPALIKAKITETKTSARMWLVVDEDNQDSFKAHLFEVPSDFQEHQKNDAFTISNEDVLDWMLNDNGEAYGAYTIRVQRESMNEEEKQEMDEYMGINKYL